MFLLFANWKINRKKKITANSLFTLTFPPHPFFRRNSFPSTIGHKFYCIIHHFLFTYHLPDMSNKFLFRFRQSHWNSIPSVESSELFLQRRKIYFCINFKTVYSLSVGILIWMKHFSFCICGISKYLCSKAFDIRSIALPFTSPSCSQSASFRKLQNRRI